jgi:hypothetical protein
MGDRQKELDSLQLAVAHAVEPLGRVTLATPYKSLRRVTVEHPLGATVRLVISGEFRGRCYLISVLKIQDDFNQKLTYVDNHTFRGVPAESPDLSPLVARVREALDVLIEQA